MVKPMVNKKLGKEQICIRIPPQVLERLDRIGEPMGVKRTELIRRAVEEYIQNHETPRPPRQPQ